MDNCRKERGVTTTEREKKKLFCGCSLKASSVFLKAFPKDLFAMASLAFIARQEEVMMMPDQFFFRPKK